MDYQRRERQVTYHSPACKMYLRHDFEHRCAYCGVVEDILSPIPSVRELLFEKDHFIPQDSGMSDIHKYPNLYYACKKCNGLKDNNILPLDPCVDNIWFGNHPQIKIGDASKSYFVDAQTPESKKYIEILQLNSRYQLEVREEIKRQITRKQEREDLLAQLEACSGLDPSLLSQIRSAITPAVPLNHVETLCGTSSWGRNIALAYNHLFTQGYSCQLVFNDAPCDIIITIGGITYHAEIRIGKEPNAIRLPCESLALWQKKHPHIGIIKFIPKDQQLLFYKIDFTQVDWNKKTCLFTDHIIL